MFLILNEEIEIERRKYMDNEEPTDEEIEQWSEGSTHLKQLLLS